jgi:hypothetical protein
MFLSLVDWRLHGLAWTLDDSKIKQWDTLIMGRPALSNTDRSTVWLADLIEATEVVATSAEPCDPAIVQAFSDRWEKRADIRALPRVRMN